MSTGRYAVSYHEGVGDPHYDLFLEAGETLLTWRLSEPPEHGHVVAVRKPDHRKVYLDYSGPLSSLRGWVTIHSAGTFVWNGETLILEGGKSAGRYRFPGEKLLEAESPAP